MKICIRDARIFLPEGSLYQGDLLIENGTISQIDRRVDSPHLDEVIEANGQVLLPGVIDPQVHFREPGKEHKEDLQTGSHACARGGVTSFLEMPNTDPLTISQATLDDKLARAASKCVVNYGFFIGATASNLAALQAIRGACGIKIFMGSMQGDLLVGDPAILETIFAHTSQLIAVHAESQARILERRALWVGQSDVALHSQIQDDQAALQATQLALRLSIQYRHRLHILHLSTALEVDCLAQQKPAWVTAEVTPQHLLLSTEDYAKLGSLAQMNPPLRDPQDCQRLWEGLHTGVIDMIATDHAPHTLTEKALPYPQSPSGMPGVETALPLMLTAMQAGRCTLPQVVRWMCEAPARGYGIRQKGKIQVGWDADLVLVNLEESRPVVREELLTKCGWSPFEGWLLTGWPSLTLVGGQIAFQSGRINLATRGQALQFHPADFPYI
ncbi:MAG: dihydroorotase [Cyanobacteriota bacterium]|nr:dihydroorotase [Cyanobacteriota bacterium]